MSPKGSLVAYSTPANIKQIRDQAALASMALTDQKTNPTGHSIGVSTQRVGLAIEVLTIEADEYNLVAQQVQDDLYIVLVGKCAPQALPQASEVPEASQDHAETIDGYDDSHVNIFTATSSHSFTEELRKAHRTKADSLAKYIRSELEGLSMPNDTNYGRSVT